jgi:hypothetical protein
MKHLKLYKKFNEETKFQVERDLVNIQIIDDLKLILLELEDLNFENEIIVNNIRYTARDVEKPEVVKSIKITTSPENYNLKSNKSAELLDVFRRIRDFMSINNFDFSLRGRVLDSSIWGLNNTFDIYIDEIKDDDLEVYHYFIIDSRISKIEKKNKLTKYENHTLL